MPEAAGSLLSAFMARRSSLTHSITVWNQIAFIGTVTIWTAVAVKDANYIVLIPLASAMTSLLLAVWRTHSRFIDNSIVALYPVIRLCEGELLPNQTLCTLKLPNVANRDALASDLRTVDPDPSMHCLVRNAVFRSRGHAWLDVLAILLMLTTALLVLLPHIKDGTNICDLALWRTYPFCLLSINILSVIWVIGYWLWWNEQTHSWALRGKHAYD